MTKTLEEKVKALKERVGNKVFYYDDCLGITSITTLKKYNLIHKVNRIEKKSLSLDNIVELLNFYSEDEEYRLENGKIYCYEREYGYQFN